MVKKLGNIKLVSPHGGKLVNCFNKNRKIDGELQEIILDSKQISDIEMIAIGGFSPLEGFMNSEDYHLVIRDMKLTNGTIWPLPVTLPVTEDIANNLDEGSEVVLKNESKQTIGVLKLEEKYHYDKKFEAKQVFETTDLAHPGVRLLFSQGDVLLAGKIELVKKLTHEEFQEFYLTPEETREKFLKNGWKTIVGFQTRNPIHRAHEYLQKCALEIFDALFIHPIVGYTKKDDVPAKIRMKCYEILVEKYYPKERVLLGINPANMRYAGPREAIFHAIIRKNYGCTHFIVGRDHAGVNNYYKPYAAQEIFKKFSTEELGITPVFFGNAFYCKECHVMASKKTCPHSSENWIVLSGTKVRCLLKEKKPVPREYMRSEVVKILEKYYQRV
ncbi:MAG: sulfate adenylyltransferase [Candidatus Helarchaeota archaeon]